MGNIIVNRDFSHKKNQNSERITLEICPFVENQQSYNLFIFRKSRLDDFHRKNSEKTLENFFYLHLCYFSIVSAQRLGNDSLIDVLSGES